MNETSSTPQVPTTAAQVKYQLVSELGKRWKPGDRLPPLAALATELGVGQRSTYQALRELSEQGLLVARQGKGTFVSLPLDQELVQRLVKEGQASGDGMLPLSGMSVCLLTAGEHPDAMIQQMVQAAETELQAVGVRVTRARHPQQNDLRSLANHPADALMLINPNTSSPISFDPRHRLSIVSTTAHVEVASGEGFDLVSPSEEQGGFLAGRYLRQQGCKCPAFLGAANPANPSEYDATCQTRLRGFEAGFEQSVPASRRFMTKRYGLSAGACAMVEYQCLAKRPDGIFAASDEIMVGFIMGAMAIGLHHGRDYHIVGFDGQYPFRHMDDLLLTSVIVPAAELGTQAARLLIERLRQPGLHIRRLSIGCTLPALQHEGSASSSQAFISGNLDTAK